MRRIGIIFAAALLLASCSGNSKIKVIPSTPDDPADPESPETAAQDVSARAAKWDGEKRAAITYQVLVYSFADGDGDGYGDLDGLRTKLEAGYFDSLGVNALWLSPIHPSQSYHGYDVTDYTAVSDKLGTMADFTALVEAAHKKDIKVYLDFVLNHTGTRHPWFQSARAAEDSPYRSYYTFSKDPAQDIKDGKVAMIATEGAGGYEAKEWYGAGGGWYWHSNFQTDWFADLDYGPAGEWETSGTFKAMTEAAEGWIARGVDGFRLDAVKHIYHNPSGSENPAFLKAFYDRCNAAYRAAGGSGDIYMVGEVLSEHDAVAPYYAGLPALFEFSFWYRLQWALGEGTGMYFVKDILGYLDEYKAVRSDYIEATKLSNHDEQRTGSVLGQSTDKMKLAAAVLLTAGGEPYIYQGEELGYWGTQSGGDEYVRTPILWDAAGQDVAKAGVNGKVDNAMLKADLSVERQAADAASVLETYRRFAQLRATYPALAKGAMSRHATYNDGNGTYPSLACWYRTSGTEKMLVVHNFGSSAVSAAFSADDLSQPVALLGTASVKDKTLTLGARSSVVFKQ